MLSLGLLPTLFAACNSCGKDRPYVPFPVDSAIPNPTEAPLASAVPSANPVTVPEPILLTEARRIEPPTGRIEVEGRTIEVPKNSVVDWSLEQDFNGDGKMDVLVWSRPEKVDERYEGALAELWFFPTGADAKVIYRLPGWLPSGPGCTIEPHLQGLPEGSAWLDVQSRCSASLPQRTPTRLLAWFTPSQSKSLILGLRVAEPLEGESLTISPKLGDRDGDGRPDFALSFEMAYAATATTARVEFGWLDRAAGASLDDGHFNTSLEPTFRAWESKLGKKTTGTGLGRETETLRRLLHHLCQQSATSRVWDIQGDPLRCPNLQRLSARLGRIEIKSAFLSNDIGLALRSFSYTNHWLGELPSVERESLRKLFDKQLSIVKPQLPVTVSVKPKPGNGQLRYSPLRFDENGTLTLITEANTLARVGLDGTSTPIETDAETPWPLEVTAADGRKWVSVVPACDRAEMLLAATLPNGSYAPLTPLSLLAPRPGVCRNPANWPTPVAPIAWNDATPTAVVDGICLSLQGSSVCQTPAKLGPVKPGSPRSPDGRRLVFVSALGPIVYGGGKPERWDSPEFDVNSLTDCVVSNEARSIACIQRGKVVLVTRPESEP
jgi:hypothetical protein